MGTGRVLDTMVLVNELLTICEAIVPYADRYDLFRQELATRIRSLHDGGWRQWTSHTHLLSQVGRAAQRGE